MSTGPSCSRAACTEGINLRSFGHGHATNTIGLAQLREIRIQQRSCGVVPLVEELLPLAYHAKKSVVDDRNVDL